MEIRICKTCDLEKSIDEFKVGRLSCIDCVKIAKSEANRKWYEKNRLTIIQKRLNYQQENRQDYNRRHREYREKLRLECYDILGNSCACGETDVVVFQIDHINDNGVEDRQLAPHQLLLKVRDKPEEYQILCANCNWRKRKSWLLRNSLTTELRNRAIVKYGGCCVECNTDDFEVLQFDHVNNDGVNNFRRRVMKDRYKSYINDDHDIQLLCCNCHQRKSLKLLKV